MLSLRFIVLIASIFLTACTSSSPIAATEDENSSYYQTNNHATLFAPTSAESHTPETLRNQIDYRKKALDLSDFFTAAHINIIATDQYILFRIPTYYLFDMKNKIKPSMYYYLNEIINLAKSPEYKNVSIYGFTDSQGKLYDNLSLSKKWTITIKNYLLLEGVDKNKIKAEGRGQFSPIASNFTLEGRLQNRRIDIILK